jgi:hypothetical protein
MLVLLHVNIENRNSAAIYIVNPEQLQVKSRLKNRYYLEIQSKTSRQHKDGTTAS